MPSGESDDERARPGRGHQLRAFADRDIRLADDRLAAEQRADRLVGGIARGLAADRGDVQPAPGAASG